MVAFQSERPRTSSLSLATRSNGSAMLLIRYSRSPLSSGRSRRILKACTQPGDPGRKELKPTIWPIL